MQYDNWYTCFYVRYSEEVGRERTGRLYTRCAGQINIYRQIHVQSAVSCQPFLVDTRVSLCDRSVTGRIQTGTTADIRSQPSCVHIVTHRPRTVFRRRRRKLTSFRRRFTNSPTLHYAWKYSQHARPQVPTLTGDKNSRPNNNYCDYVIK